MAKKRKHKNQNWGDWDDVPDSSDILEGNGDAFQVHLEDYVIKEKVSAFRRCYEPCNEFDANCEQFDEAKLRDFFKATVCGLGDPLKIYIEDLKYAGFQMEVSIATGEPSIFARKKN